MDISIGKYSFKAKTLKSISKTRALSCFLNIDRPIVERAWAEANPKRVKLKPPRKTK